MFILLTGLLLCLYFTWSVYLSISNGIGEQNVERALVKRPETQVHVMCLGIGNVIINAPMNDDYCDCLGGTDEPLTSACSWITAGKAVYNCNNEQKQFIFSSRIDDGVDDCRDTELDEVYGWYTKQKNNVEINFHYLRTRTLSQV